LEPAGGGKEALFGRFGPRGRASNKPFSDLSDSF
jgi:hypothetical protein